MEVILERTLSRALAEMLEFCCVVSGLGLGHMLDGSFALALEWFLLVAHFDTDVVS